MILRIEHMEAAVEEFKFGLSCQMKGTKILQHKDQQYTSMQQDTFREVVLKDGHQIYSSGRFRMTPQSRRFVIDNVPPEALPSELAAFLNIPLETTDTKLEMAMDMRTGMGTGVAFITLPHRKSNYLMWSKGRSFLGHRLSIQLVDPFEFEKQSGDTGFGGGASNRRSTGN